MYKPILRNKARSTILQKYPRELKEICYENKSTLALKKTLDLQQSNQNIEKNSLQIPKSSGYRNQRAELRSRI